MQKNYTLKEAIAIVLDARQKNLPIPKSVINWWHARERNMLQKQEKLSEAEQLLRKELAEEFREDELQQQKREQLEEDDIDLVPDIIPDLTAPPKPEMVKMQMGPSLDEIVLLLAEKNVEIVLQAGGELGKKASELAHVDPDLSSVLVELFGVHKPEFAQRVECVKEKNGDFVLQFPASDVRSFTEHFQGQGFAVTASLAVAQILDPTPKPGNKKQQEEEAAQSTQVSSLYQTPRLTKE